MTSDEPSELSGLPDLEQKFLAALRDNDLDRLVQFNAELSRVGHVIEQAFSWKSSISKDKATTISVFSHNVHVASSLAEKAQLEMDELSSRFTRQLGLLSLQDSASVEGSSSVQNVALKEWSLLHLSHLFPSKEQVEELTSHTSMSSKQINLWFRNARTRSGWSKLFAHPRVNRNHEQLKTLLAEHDSIKRRAGPEHFKAFLAQDQLIQLMDKVFQWFATTKQVHSSDSVKPWIKEVLNNTLATLKDKTAGAIDSSRQLLPSLPSRKRARIKKNAPSSSPLSQLSTPIAGPSKTHSPISDSSQPTTTGSFSSAGSVSNIAFSPFLGPPSHESSYSGDPSPASVSTSISSFHLLQASPIFSFLPGSTLCPPTVPTPSGPAHSNSLNQFEDADEV